MLSSFVFDNTGKRLNSRGRRTSRRSNDGRCTIVLMVMMIKRVQTLKSMKRLMVMFRVVMISIGRGRYELKTVPAGRCLLALLVVVAVAVAMGLRLLLSV